MPQFVLPCPAVTGFKLQTMVLDQKCKPSIHGHFKGSLPRPKTAFFGGIAQHGEGEGGESEPQIDFDTFSVKQVAQIGVRRGAFPN